MNELPHGSSSKASDDAVAEISVSTDMVLRRGDRRLIIDSKKQLKKLMAYHLNTVLESLRNYW